ncbi:hypothetical protein [Legionella cherrii]|uniref:Uncharacterized protein n=1 Tax=Legionella cherrii TaxID=28084 RepID=A0ABY6T7P2_9GAMM|nr:hypothetical protein [Legionella cherrii]VEB37442.1 Uncharacterised protein [Legionella cherrii]
MGADHSSRVHRAVARSYNLRSGYKLSGVLYMFQWFFRLLLVISGSIASWFVARDELKFPIVQMVIAVILFTLFIGMIAFWPELKNWFKRIRKDH